MNENEHGQPIGFPVTDWVNAMPPTREPIEGMYTQLVCVQDMSASHSLYQAFVKDTKGLNWTYLPYGPFKNLSDFNDWFEQTCFGDDPLFHVIYDKSSKDAIGLASLMRINPTAGSIEVGHVHFSPLLQRTPMATEAMYLMMKRVFDELGYRRYEWKCDALNKPSKNAALRLGFIYEGTFRQALMYKQRNRDTAWFSVTDKEWPVVKAGFEAWLRQSNFDSNANQIESLVALRTRLS